MWTNDTDSIFTGTERTFADDWASTAQDATGATRPTSRPPADLTTPPNLTNRKARP